MKMNVYLQGKKVLKDFDGGSFDNIVRKKFPVKVKKDGFRLELERVGENSEWGISALILRPE